MYILENTPGMEDCAGNTAPMSRYALRQYIVENSGDLYRDQQLRLTIMDPQTSVACGFLDLTDLAPKHRRAQVGIALMPDATGRGLATEALKELADYARKQGLAQLYAVVQVHNTAARALFLRAGYTEANFLSEWLLQNGHYTDAVLFRLRL